MKKLIILITILGCIVLGCNNKNDKITTTTQDSLRDNDSEEAMGKNCKPLDLTPYKELPLDSAKKMAKNYREFIWQNPKKAIQLVKFNGQFLSNLVCKMDSVKFISALRMGDSTTIIIQLAKNGMKSYYDITEFKTLNLKESNSLCPEPLHCEETEW